MDDYPRFVNAPPQRCCFRSPQLPGGICGAIATVKRRGNMLFADTYFCDKHCAPIDVALDAAPVFRRVRLEAEITFAGVSQLPGEAEAEAASRLEAAVRAIGGRLMVHSASSHVGRAIDARDARGA